MTPEHVHQLGQLGLALVAAGFISCVLALLVAVVTNWHQ
jgi:hypothetical protein